MRTAPASGGNIDVPAGFVAQNQGDLHLGAGSPCRGAGDPAAPGVPTHDFEGDPRGATVAIGHDQHALHLYHLGRVTAGNTVRWRVVGAPPGGTCTMFASVNVYDPPVSTSAGLLFLGLPRVVVLDAAPVPASGVVDVDWLVPPMFGPGAAGSFVEHALYAQALAGSLTPLEVLGFR